MKLNFADITELSCIAITFIPVLALMLLTLGLLLGVDIQPDTDPTATQAPGQYVPMPRPLPGGGLSFW